ncbi:hypothetical protein GGS20DRAFT_567360 [Poronia punctata]|nr:hypothetical protein GGS20DRAFT_567360 [Poronia punctata]
MQTKFLASILTIALGASAAAVSRRDPVLGDPTCGVDGADTFLNHDDLGRAVDDFANWVASGADGQVNIAGNFRGGLSREWGEVLLFACDSKSGGQGSYISPELIRQVLEGGGYLDSQCKQDNAGYESSNDLTIGRTFKGDHFCD